MILLSSNSALFVLSAAAILGAALIAGRTTGKHIEINIVSPEILLPNALSKMVGFFSYFNTDYNRVYQADDGNYYAYPQADDGNYYAYPRQEVEPVEEPASILEWVIQGKLCQKICLVCTI